ncbi:D-alanine--D-alanine ligase [Streptomyces sp. RK9]|uniref:D-alanine--D-alanine ligase family protein n=1 Tax=Streptomyces sp. RK9 TaxID=3239284 RepID=UPI00386B6B84
MRAVVLCGGESVERAVSLDSGISVARALIDLDYDVSVVDPAADEPFICRSTRNHDDLPRPTVAADLPAIGTRKSQRNVFSALTSEAMVATLRRADLVFPALHGGWGGDGHIQAMLEMADISFAGAGSAACSLAWDKHSTLRVLRDSGVTVSRWEVHPAGDCQVRSGVLSMLDDGPVVVKLLAGTSYSTLFLARGADELAAASSESAGGEDWLISPFLPGREFTVGVLGDHVLPVVEIECNGPLYDFEAKNRPGASRRRSPADVTSAFRVRLQEQALSAHRAVGLGSGEYSRVDFRCDNRGEPHCLEVNACPALRTGGGLAAAANALGWTFPKLIEEIARLPPSRLRSA